MDELNYESIDIEESNPDVEQIETIEYVEVEDVEEIVVETDEAFASFASNGEAVKHNDLGGRDDTGQHPISAIDGLEGVIKTLASTENVYAKSGGLAEFQKWKDENITENRIGYFVSLINYNGNECIEICNKESEDVYGVTVVDSAFCGNQDSNYNILNGTNNNRANSNQPFAKVCLLGTVEVRFGGSQAEFNSLKSGDYVVPGNNGCAIKSENNIGFKVIMKEAAGVGVNAWNNVTIALVPQNDNVARVMKTLEETNKGLDEINIQLGNLNEKVDTNISISGDFEDLKDLVDQNTANVNQKLEAVDTTLEEAQQISSDAQKAMENMTTNYTEAMDQTKMAIDIANEALGQINDYDLETLAEYKGNIVSFFSEATEDEVTIGTIARTQGDVSMIKQSSNVIQHLVCSVDVYSVGNQSPTSGLSYDEAHGALGIYEYIYVPIGTHIEESHIYKCNSATNEAETDCYFMIGSTTYLFESPVDLTNRTLTFNARTNQLIISGDNNDEYDVKVQINVKIPDGTPTLEFSTEKSITFVEGMSYKWDNESTNKFWWVENLPVSFAEYPPESEFELWYTKNEKTVGEIIYNPGTLYRLINGLWVAVATINDNNARIVSLINQTADSLSSTITNVAGDVSDIRQTVNEINLTVSDHNGKLSEIEQTAENVRLGVYNPGGGASELELLLSGFSSTVAETGSVKVCEILDTSPTATVYYATAPSWNGEKFEFGGNTVDQAVGTYCEGVQPNTYYEITENGYIVYTNGNTTIAAINTRVSNTESEITKLTEIDTELGKNITAAIDKSTENSAQISSIASMQNAICLETKANLDEEEINLFSNAAKYNKPPIWDGEEFVFQSESSEDGIYCMVNEDTENYYKILTSEGNIIGYEQYGLSSAKLAVIKQEIDKNGAFISMVVDDNGVKGGVVVGAINGQSDVLIEADKITLNGTTTFADTLNSDKTAISGDYIRTGVITSNNYSGPVTYRMYGMTIKKSPSSDVVCSFTSGVTKMILPNGGTHTLPDDRRYIGVDLDIADGDYYYLYNDEFQTLHVFHQEALYVDKEGVSQNAIVHLYLTSQLSVPDGEIVSIYASEEHNHQLVASEDASKCIHYTPIVNGELSITDDYYYASKIEADAILFSERQETEDENKSQYIVSEVYFDLVPSDIEIEGTKFNLNNGSIYSKNLILDNGDLSITGKISATSGYIGDDANGFTIDNNGGYYALTNRQNSFLGRDNGENYGDPGIYISPQGIGMGHGRFEAPNTGYYFRVAGIRLSFIGNFKFGDYTYPVCAIDSSTSDSRGLSLGEYDDVFGNYSYSSMLLEPRSTSTTSCDAKLHLWGQVVTYSNNAISELSDARLKTNIVDTNINAIETIKKIETKSFDWINSGEYVDIGLIAQQVEQVSPSLVLTNEKTGLKSINTTKLIPYLIKAVQELSEIVCPSVSLLSLDEESTSETHWVDDMSDEEKQYYVGLAMAPRYKIKD